MAIPKDIQELARRVRTAVYGRDVRESIARSMEITGNTADEAKKVTEQLIDGSFDSGLLNTNIEKKLNNLETEYAPKLTKLTSDLTETLNRVNSIEINVKYPPPPLIGAKGDGITDDTSSLVSIFEYIETLNTRVKLKFPSGVYLVNTDSLKEGFNISRVVIEGEFTGILQNYTQDKNIGTYILDKSVTSTFPLFQFGSSTERTMGGLKVSNIQIVGNRQSRDAIRLERIGWEIVFENVYVDNFGGAGLLLNSCYDSSFNNITITRCGGHTIDGLLRRSLDFIVTDGEINNAVKFNNLHIEDTYFMIGFTNVRHCYFTNSKFEIGVWSAAAKESMANTDITQQPIKIRDSLEISFVNTFFVSMNVDNFESAGISLTNIPYFIDYDNPYYNDLSNTQSSLKFTNCDFSTSISGSGAKFIKNTSKTTVMINNCIFDWLSGRVYSIDLQGIHSTITNSKIVINNYTYGELRAIQVTDGLIKDCTVTTSRTSPISDINGVYTVFVRGLGKCENVDVRVGKYKIGTDSTQAVIKRIPRRVSVTDSTISSYSTLDYSNIVLDLSVIDSNVIKLSLGANATIKGVKNGGIGEEITIFIDNGRTYTFSYDTSKNSDAIKVQAGVSMKGEDVIKLVKFDHLWRDIAYSNLDGA